MAKYKLYNYDQMEMLVLNLQDQLQPGTFEYAIHHLIEHRVDLSCFDEQYKNDETGRLAYHPGILLKIILFAYSKGITSSREIERCCLHHVLFKALSCNTVPHFTTIASFISRQPENIEQLFEQVLLVCHEEGLLGNELFAIDDYMDVGGRATQEPKPKAARCHPMQQKNGRAHSKSFGRSATSSRN